MRKYTDERLTDEQMDRLTVALLGSRVDGVPLHCLNLDHDEPRWLQFGGPSTQYDAFAAGSDPWHTVTTVDLLAEQEDGRTQLEWSVQIVTPAGTIPTVDDVLDAARLCLTSGTELGADKFARAEDEGDLVERRELRPAGHA